MHLKNKKNVDKDISLKDTYGVLQKINISWIWIIIAFAFSMGYNKFLLYIPTITADLSSGDLSSAAIWKAVGVYVLSFALSEVMTVSSGMARSVSGRNARRNIWKQMLHIRMDYYDSNNPSELMSAITNDIVMAIQYIVLITVRLLPDTYYHEPVALHRRRAGQHTGHKAEDVLRPQGIDFRGHPLIENPGTDSIPADEIPRDLLIQRFFPHVLCRQVNPQNATHVATKHPGTSSLSANPVV
jgi:ABC-type multidrug transport system fused ATPase/permease subunit